jgi:hypothetical protein
LKTWSQDPKPQTIAITITETEAEEELVMSSSKTDRAEESNESIRIREELINDPNIVSGGFAMMAKSFSGQKKKADESFRNSKK